MHLAPGQALRYDRRSRPQRNAPQTPLRFRGVENRSVVVYEAEGYGGGESFIRTLMVKALWIERFHTAKFCAKRSWPSEERSSRGWLIRQSAPGEGRRLGCI